MENELASLVAEARRAIDDSGKSREVTERAIVEIRRDMADIKAASDAATIAASQRASGSDADFVRAYTGDTGVSRSSVLDWSPGCDGALSERVTHLSRKGTTEPVRFLGGRDDLGQYRFGVLDDPKPKTEWQSELQNLVALRSIGQACKVEMPVVTKRIARHLASGPAGIARMFADNAGEGAEFMPTAVSAVLDRYASLPRVVSGLFQEEQISGVDVQNPFVASGAVPKLGVGPVAGDNNPATITVGNPTTSSRTMVASTMLVNILATMDASEDSIVQWTPWALSEAMIALADGYEDALINGDSTATHEDAIASWTGGGRWPSTGMGGADDHRRSFKGLRRLAVDASAMSDGSGADTVVGAIAQRATLAGAHRGGNLVYIVSLGNLIAKLLPDTNILTLDKAGVHATMLTGQVAMIGGYPVVVSEFLTEDLASTGLYTGSGATSGMLLANRDQFRTVRRMGPTSALQSVERDNVVYLTARARRGFHPIQSSTTKTVSFRRNLAIS